MCFGCAGRYLDDGLIHRMTKLADQHHPVSLENRNDCHRERMSDRLPMKDFSVGGFVGVAGQTDSPALEEDFRTHVAETEVFHQGAIIAPNVESRLDTIP